MLEIQQNWFMLRLFLYKDERECSNCQQSKPGKLFKSFSNIFFQHDHTYCEGKKKATDIKLSTASNCPSAACGPVNECPLCCRYQVVPSCTCKEYIKTYNSWLLSHIIIHLLSCEFLRTI